VNIETLQCTTMGGVGGEKKCSAYTFSAISSVKLPSNKGINLWKYEYLSRRCNNHSPTTVVTACRTYTDTKRLFKICQENIRKIKK